MRATLVVLLVVACGDAPKAPPRRDFTAHPAVVELSGVGTIDALGDVHGDLAATVQLLGAAGLVGRAPYHWTGGTRTLVVTGDVIDKGSEAIAIIDLFIGLEPEARAAGGALVVTLGNHEAGFLASPTDEKSAQFQAELRALGLDPKRVAAGEGRYGQWLHQRPLGARIDGWFFCHGGNTSGLSAAELGTRFRALYERGKAYSDDLLAGDQSLLEASIWWPKDGRATATLDADLGALPAQHLVFGHEPGDVPFPDDPHGDRPKGELAARYEGRIFLIDSGMSSAIGYSRGALLRIERNPDRASVIDHRGDSRPIWP